MRTVALVTSLVSLVAIAAMGMARTGEKLEAPVDAQGNLHVPSDYRAAYEFLGAWAIAANGSVGSRERHIVSATPGALSTYRSSGHFADGTVVIKEVYETATAPMTTGTVSHAALLKGWFVMVKDGQN